QPSHVLLAMGVPEAEARGALRFWLGRTSTPEDDAMLVEALPEAVERARAAGLASAWERVHARAWAESHPRRAPPRRRRRPEAARGRAEARRGLARGARAGRGGGARVRVRGRSR